MQSSASQYFSKYHWLFNNENIFAQPEAKDDFISSIWDDYHILGLVKITGNAYGILKNFK